MKSEPFYFCLSRLRSKDNIQDYSEMVNNLFFSVLIDVVLCACTDSNAIFTDRIDTMILYIQLCSPRYCRGL